MRTALLFCVRPLRLEHVFRAFWSSRIVKWKSSEGISFSTGRNRKHIEFIKTNLVGRTHENEFYKLRGPTVLFFGHLSMHGLSQPEIRMDSDIDDRNWVTACHHSNLEFQLVIYETLSDLIGLNVLLYNFSRRLKIGHLRLSYSGHNTSFVNSC